MIKEVYLPLLRMVLADVRAAISEMFSPQLHVLSDEDQQTAAEHSRVIAEWIDSRRHPKACDVGCQCHFPDGAA